MARIDIETLNRLAVAALEGLLSPMGAYKGSGLSKAVDILSGALSGAKILSDISGWDEAPDRAQGLGHFFLLLDPARLIGRDAFLDAMDRLREIVLSTPPTDPATPVLLPGQIEQERHAAALRDGVAIPDHLPAEIEALAAG
jgi:LDH2 family malate/lactate/ureidoglycolate dehydrogenase